MPSRLLICSGDHPFADDSMIDFRAAAETELGVGWSLIRSEVDGWGWAGDAWDMLMDGGLSMVSGVSMRCKRGEWSR
jgi:hypothetical protein